MDSMNPYKAPTAPSGDLLPKKPAMIGPLLAFSILSFGIAFPMGIARLAIESHWLADVLLLFLLGLGAMSLRASYAMHRQWHRSKVRSRATP